MVGCRYSINWYLPKIGRRAIPESLVAEAETFRKLLVRYRNRWRAGEKINDQQIGSFHNILRSLYEILRQRFPSIDNEEKFDVTLMTFDANDPALKPALVVVDGLVNGEDLPNPYWDLRLPPGIGNAGTCFKTGKLWGYVDREASEEFSYYVPVEGIDHQVLVSVPLDHPEFAKEVEKTRKLMEDPERAETARGKLREIQSERKRQVVAIINVGSNSQASSLRQVFSENGDSTPESREMTDDLVAVCQYHLNKLWDILVEPSP